MTNVHIKWKLDVVQFQAGCKHKPRYEVKALLYRGFYEEFTEAIFIHVITVHIPFVLVLLICSLVIRQRKRLESRLRQSRQS